MRNDCVHIVKAEDLLRISPLFSTHARVIDFVKLYTFDWAANSARLETQRLVTVR